MPKVNSCEPAEYVVTQNNCLPIIQGESIPLADEVTLELEIDGSETKVSVDGEWFVDSERRSVFACRLQGLISEYQI